MHDVNHYGEPHLFFDRDSVSTKFVAILVSLTLICSFLQFSVLTELAEAEGISSEPTAERMYESADGEAGADSSYPGDASGNSAQGTPTTPGNGVGSTGSTGSTNPDGTPGGTPPTGGTHPGDSNGSPSEGDIANPDGNPDDNPTDNPGGNSDTTDPDGADHDASDNNAGDTSTDASSSESASNEAQARASSYTITFDLNYGSGTVPRQVTTPAGSFVQLPTNDGFWRTNYAFSGWAEVRDAGITQANVAQNGLYAAHSYFQMPSRNVTLYAQWAQTGGTKNAHMVIAVNKGNTIPSEPKVIDYDESQIVYLYSYMKKAGHESKDLMRYIKRAYTTKNADEVVALLTDAFYSDVQGWLNTNRNIKDLKLNAKTDIKWYVVKEQRNNPNVYPYPAEITWHIDGIVVNDTNKVALDYSTNCNDTSVFRPGGGTYVRGTEVAIAKGIIRAGYTFTGWNTKSDGSGINVKPESRYRLTENTTLYAQWKINDVRINYVPVGGGTVSLDSEQLNPLTGDARGSHAQPHDGYRFVGWFDNPNLSGQPLSEQATYAPLRPASGWADNTTFYAGFAKRTDLAYRVFHYTMKTDGSDKRLVTQSTFNDGEYESTVKAADKKITIPGYAYHSAQPTQITIGLDETANVMSLFYVADFSQVGINAIHKVYNGETSELVPQGVLGSDVVSYYYGTLAQYDAGELDDDDLVSKNAFIAVMDESIVMVVQRGSEFFALETSVVIEQRPVTVWALEANYVYASGADQVHFLGYNLEQTAPERPLRGLISGDTLGEAALSVVHDVDRYDVGTHPDQVIVHIAQPNSNYRIEYVAGPFVVTASGANIVTGINLSESDGLTKVYDAEAATVEASALIPDSTLWYSLDQVDWSETKPTFTDVGVYPVYVKATRANYVDTAVSEAVVTIQPAPAIITVSDAAKTLGEVDPAFEGMVEGLFAEGDIGTVTYFRTNAEETVGVYANVLSALYDGNEKGNYRVEVRPATFTINAPAIVPPVPVVPPGPGAPVPIAAPPAAGVEFIPDAGVPLATVENIADDENPLGVFDADPECWIHMLILVGMIITGLYALGVLGRREFWDSEVAAH